MAFLIVPVAAESRSFAQTLPSDLNLVALFPAKNSAAICPDTPLRLTFSSPPVLGSSGKIQVIDAHSNQAVEVIDISSKTATQMIGGISDFTYYPVIISGNDATIYLHNHTLKYGDSYYVTIDPGVFKSQNDWSGFSSSGDWHFATRSSGPAAGATDITVAADGSGDFCTVQGAIDFVPDKNTTPTTIVLKKGTYTEIVCINKKNSLTIKGEDRQGSVIAYANNNRFAQKPGMRIYRRGVFLAYQCDDLWLTNLTVRNTTPRGGSQAEAIIFVGDTRAHARVTDVDLYSFQDTLQINGQGYVANCYIEGDVDFLWGTGPCYFDNCHLYETRDKAYYTQVRNPPSNHGYVFHHCVLDGPPDITQSYLTRVDPKAYPYSEVVFLDCVIGRPVLPVGWFLSKPRPTTQPNPGNSTAAVDPPNPSTPPDLTKLHFLEFNSHDADGHPIDPSERLAVSRQLTEPDDAATIAEYSNVGWVMGDGWNPQIENSTATLPTTAGK